MSAARIEERLVHVRERLTAAGQEHVLAFWDGLTGADRSAFLDQLETLDLEGLRALLRAAVPEGPAAGGLAPIYPVSLREDGAAYRTVGEDLLRAGKVAAFTVAGGQGSRLGFDAPKGLFPAAPVTGKSLFQLFAEQIIATGQRYGRVPSWYVMTSPTTDSPTRAFFAEHDAFGLAPAGIRFVVQGELPALDLASGRLMLATKGTLALSPDGHGGAIRALERGGCLAEMRAAGVEHISYFQVDNPLVRALDPAFLGLHAAHPASSAEVTSKCVVKLSPDERVGVFARDNHGVRVIEYSDLPATLAAAHEPGGQLRFRAASIAAHAFSVAFLERVAAGRRLPFHRAEKAVPCVDPVTGRPVLPEAPNALKFEQFIFDALPLAVASLVVETERSEEFAPIKNARGEDSPETSRRAQSERAARWLAAAGVEVSPLATVEISPCTALEPAGLGGCVLPRRVEPGARLAL